jgi:archaellum component FlaC
MKRLLTLLLLLSCCLYSVPANAQDDGEKIRITFEFSPQPEHMQLWDDRSYVISVAVRNQDLTVKEGEAFDSDEPLYLFSGELIIEVVETLRKEGSYLQEGGSASYNHTIERTQDVFNEPLPSKGRSLKKYFSFESAHRYDGATVDLDEWMTYSVDVYVNIEEYREVPGDRRYYVGDLLGEAHVRYNVMGGEKEGYVRGALEALEEQVEDVEGSLEKVEAATREDVDLDLTAYQGLLATMTAQVDAGDYVSAMETYSLYDPSWRDALIDALLDEIDYLGDQRRLLEQQMEGLEEQIQSLADEIAALESDYESATSAYETEKEQLQSEVNAARGGSQIYLFSTAALAVVLIYLLYRMFRGGSGSPSEEVGDPLAFPTL